MSLKQIFSCLHQFWEANNSPSWMILILNWHLFGLIWIFFSNMISCFKDIQVNWRMLCSAKCCLCLKSDWWKSKCWKLCYASLDPLIHWWQTRAHTLTQGQKIPPGWYVLAAFPFIFNTFTLTNLGCSYEQQ